MFTDERINEMTVEELKKALKSLDILYTCSTKKCERLEQILSCIGFAYSTYEKEYNNG